MTLVRGRPYKEFTMEDYIDTLDTTLPEEDITPYIDFVNTGQGIDDLKGGKMPEIVIGVSVEF